MKKRITLLTVGVFVCAAALLPAGGCGEDVEGQGEGKTYELSYGIFFPEKHIQYKTAERWAREVEKRSEGKLKITLFAGKTLLTAPKCYQEVVDGVADIGMSCFAYTRGRFPLMEALDLPMGYPDGKTATRVAHEIAKKHKPKELNDVHVLYIHAHGPGILASKKPVRTLEDMKGLDVRTTGQTKKLAEALGADPTAKPQGETYEMLQKGVVQATFCPMETLQFWGQGEVIDCVTDTSAIGYTTSMFVVMNKDRWESLPPELQKILTEVSEEWVAKSGEAWDEADEQGREFVEGLEPKREFITLPADEEKRWVDAARPVIGAYVERAKAKGLPADKVVEDIRKMIAE